MTLDFNQDMTQLTCEINPDDITNLKEYLVPNFLKTHKDTLIDVLLKCDLDPNIWGVTSYFFKPPCATNPYSDTLVVVLRPSALGRNLQDLT